MKLSPAVTCITAVHMKPYLRDSLNSLLAQTRQADIAVIVVDSGQWMGKQDALSLKMRAVYDDFCDEPLFDWVFTGEGPRLKAEKCPIAWATNEVIRAGLVTGRYMCTFYDDDRYHPTFMERMAGFLDDNPDANAVWCSQNRIRLSEDGSEELMGVLAATGPKSVGWDCQVDGGQIMWRTALMDVIRDPWIPEDPGECRHSDGLFLEKLGAAAGTVPNIPDVLYDHRFTPISTYTPS